MNNKYTIEGVDMVIDDEGLDYAIQHYISSDNIADPELRKLWQRAKNALAEIESYIAEHLEPTDENVYR